MSNYQKPRWLRDLIRFLPLKSQFVLSGNVKDWQLFDHGQGQLGWHALRDQLTLELRDYGYKEVLSYNPVTGFDIPFFQGAAADKQAKLERVGAIADSQQANFNVEAFTLALENIVHYQEEPVAIIADFASQYGVDAEHLSKAEHNAFTRALVLSQQAQLQPFGEARQAFYNTVIWIVDKESDLPDWLLIGNPKLRHITIPKPDRLIRRAMAETLLSTLSAAAPKDSSTAAKRFVDDTESLLLLDLEAIVTLAQAEGLDMHHINDAVRRYKIGVTEDPWQKIDRDKIRAGHQFVSKRVKGQDHAIVHSLDIIKRAITGVGGDRRGRRPRGVVFLAGPTGVGKTELAKTLTSLLFGDENAYIRFDMSEFSAEHSDQRLIGAPPGYVGYDMGGELTNAVREKPFSVVLFDEIEKAHPRILDKFLQVLDDGILTSGRGDRVYFSETFIIFTSNLGIYKPSSDGQREQNVSPQDVYPDIERKVKSEIGRFFKLEINRPELLNRLGENIIVFDFIRKDVASDIFDMMIESTIKDVQAQAKINLSVSSLIKEKIKKLCIEDLSNGGRGIRNQLEHHFINPLSRALFDMAIAAGESCQIDDIKLDKSKTSLLVRKR